MSKTGFIYKLVSTDPEITDCYVGSTKNFRHRKSDHKKVCNKDTYHRHHLYVYQFIRANGGWDNWDMVQIEEFKHNTKRELHSRERYWLETLGATLNKVVPTRTNKEYREEHKEVLAEWSKVWRAENKEVLAQKKKVYHEANKEVIAQKKKVWRAENKEVIAQKQKVYHANNKEVISEKAKERYYGNREERLKKVKEYREANPEIIKQRKKIYAENNKEKIAEKQKVYRVDNKEKIKQQQSIIYQKNKQQIAEKMKEKITCDCGTTYRKCTKARHEKSKKHKDYITSLNVH